MFPGLYVNMVAAGEASGTLEAVLARLADFMEGQVKLKGKIVGALAYPAFMALMGVGILGMMMVVVVPKVSAIFDDFRQALPWYTAALIGVSQLRGQLLVGAHRARGRGGIFQRWKATARGRLPLGRLPPRVPVFGELVRMVAISRFTRTLATLLWPRACRSSRRWTSSRTSWRTACSRR
jgi:general secretion pathway protein F